MAILQDNIFSGKLRFKASLIAFTEVLTVETWQAFEKLYSYLEQVAGAPLLTHILEGRLDPT